ncbi:MAG: lysine--tRNA ligase, partial [Gemmatimonadales bacterium]
MTEELSQVLKVRREKLERIREEGIEPFPWSFRRTHLSADVLESHQEAEAEGAVPEGGDSDTVRVAGRVLSWRGHGKSAFAHIEDGGGRIQLYFRLNVLGEERFRLLELLDLGDWIGVSGPAFRTRTGEVTVRVEEWELLSKSLRPLPMGKEEKDPETGERIVHSGFTNREARYRQRYADLA